MIEMKSDLPKRTQFLLQCLIGFVLAALILGRKWGCISYGTEMDEDGMSDNDQGKAIPMSIAEKIISLITCCPPSYEPAWRTFKSYPEGLLSCSAVAISDPAYFPST